MDVSPNTDLQSLTKEEYNIAVRELSGRVFRFAIKYLKNEEDAHDIVQDSFEKLWNNRDKVEPEKARSWLFTTAHNASINLLRKNNRSRTMDTEETSWEPTSRDEARKYEMKEILDLCLEHLPDIQRSIILLRDIEGYSYQDIGEILELSESQVKVYLFRARKKIKDYVKDIRLLS